MSSNLPFLANPLITVNNWFISSSFTNWVLSSHKTTLTIPVLSVITKFRTFPFDPFSRENSCNELTSAIRPLIDTNLLISLI